jgi:TPR repeat protein
MRDVPIFVPAAFARFAGCLQSGRGIPIDFTVTIGYFNKALDLNDADGINSFGCCLERSQGIYPDIDGAVWYYRRVASLSHPDGLQLRGANYHCLSADLNHDTGQNRFGRSAL